jgi:hypothetical protein
MLSGDRRGTLDAEQLMASRGKGATSKVVETASESDLGFEKQLFKAADALRNNMDAAEYKHVVLGLIFLKYISDSFEAKHAELAAAKGKGADPEDPDEYKAENIFWVPKEARWTFLLGKAKDPKIGTIVDDAMEAVEKVNPTLKSVLPKDFGRAGLDKQRLGQLIDLIGNIGFGGKESRAKDLLGRVYEYFLSEFASAEGKKGGQFYTPRPVVRLLVNMLAPYKGRIYDPCCGSAGMFVQSEAFIEHHGGRVGDIAVYGQESNYTTWRLAKMNLAIRGIDAKITHGDSFHQDHHPDLKADFVIAKGSAPTAEVIMAMADQNGVGPVMRTLHATAVQCGLHVRPWYKSIMFAPPMAKNRCLFVVWVDRRQREPGFAKAYIAAEAFEQFYGIKEADTAAAVGPVGYVMLDQAGAERVAAGLRRLLSAREPG